MGVVERAAIVEGHREVVDAWREIVSQAGTLGLADRIVIGVTLKARAEALAAYEGLVRDAGDLAGDARAFAAAVRTQNPLTAVCWSIGLAAGVLGFFGVWGFDVVKRVVSPSSEVELAQTTVALVGVLIVAAGAVVVGVLRAAVSAGHAGLENGLVSAVLLREVRPAEERLFAVFQRQVPEPAVSSVPLIVMGIGGLLAGIAVAVLAGVGQ
ncbi:hypothetical protein [Kribbella sp. NPDC055071]